MGKVLASDVKEEKNSREGNDEADGKFIRLSYEQYLSENNIRLVENFKSIILQEVSEKKILEQLEAINSFHTISMGYTTISNKFIRNKLGKAVEKYKLNLKNLKRDIKSFSVSNSINEFESTIIDTSDEYIKRTEKCLSEVEASDYIALLKRSMRRYEITLGNTYFTNLRKNDGIEIKTLKRCSYNMVEIDGVYFLNKMKRNGFKTDFRKLIDKFCEIEGLEENSSKFMRALISYPHEYMKCVEKYRKNNKSLSIDDFRFCLRKSIEKDGESIL